MAFLLGVMLAIFVVLSIDLILGLTGFSLVAALVVESAIPVDDYLRASISHERILCPVRYRTSSEGP